MNSNRGRTKPSSAEATSRGMGVADLAEMIDRVVAKGSAVHFLDLFDQYVQCGDQYFSLVREMGVEGGVGYPELRGYPHEARSSDSVLSHQCDGRVDDLLSPLFATRSTPVRHLGLSAQ